MSIFCTHIYCKGNQVVDALASFIAAGSAYYWWSTIPDFATAGHACELKFCPIFRPPACILLFSLFFI